MEHTIIDEKFFPMFQQVGRVHRYNSGQSIFNRGQRADEIFLVLSGRVIVYSTTESGHQMTFDILKKGRLFSDTAFVRHGVRRVDIDAVTDVELLVCETKKLLPVLCQNQEVMLLMFQHLNEQCNDLVRQIMRLAYFDGKQKVADYILQITDGRIQQAPYTHSDVANGVGLTRVTVSRIMKQFKDAGFIDYTYGIIQVLDRRALEMVVEGK